MGVDAENKTRFRYPGTKFFEASQHDIFYGRKQETLDLIQAIKAYDIFVVFADSGIGKTSLLNAGIIPELVQENILPIQFRFQNPDILPLKIIVKKLSEYVNPTDATAPAGEHKLWRLFKRCDFNGKLPLFVFDQFEEFFNHSKQAREECIAELADLLNEYLPDYVKEEMKQKFREEDPTEEELKYYTPARLKMLFLIRADKLKLLDDLSKKIPLILRNRYHLKPLNASQAEEAILEPAHLPTNGFASPRFEIQPAALKEISNYLKNEEGEVEGFQLQILTQELEKRIIGRSEKEKAGNGLLITEKELGGEAGLDSITKNYYTRQLESIVDKATRKKAIELVEEKLIVEDRRISLPEVLLVKEGYSKELLDYLLNSTRLIRIDNDRYVEISHDRLLPSILKSKAQRRKKETDAKWLRTVALAIAIVLAGWVLVSYWKFSTSINARIATADKFIEHNEYKKADSILATRNLEKLFSFPFRDTLKKLRSGIDSLNKIRLAYLALINAGDSLQSVADFLMSKADSLLPDSEERDSLALFTEFETGDQQLTGAWNDYRKAVATGSEPFRKEEKVEPRLEAVSNKVSDCFTQYMNAISFFRLAAKIEQASGKNEKAKALFKRADEFYAFATSNGVSLKPEDTTYFLQKLKPFYPR